MCRSDVIRTKVIVISGWVILAGHKVVVKVAIPAPFSLEGGIPPPHLFSIPPHHLK